MKGFGCVILATAVMIFMPGTSDLFQGGQNVGAGVFFLCVGVFILQIAGRALDRRG